MQTEIKNNLLVPLLKCIQKRSEHEICRGQIYRNNNALICRVCQHQYQQVQGVPILKDAVLATPNFWFKQMYIGRNRTLELESSYLRDERKLVYEFIQKHNIQGPCLEIGCGIGLFADRVPNFIGLEYSLESLLVEGCELFTRICADAQRIPLIDSCVECIFSFNTLEHVPEVDLTFSEIDRVLKPGGFLLLKPAWHCTRYITELIPILSYKHLNLRQKITKAILPLLRSKIYKFLAKIPHRLWRRMTSCKNNPLSWRRLTPYHGELWIADADATASLDSHEAILYYHSRGYQCLSHKGILRQLTAGHDVLILRKP